MKTSITSQKNEIATKPKKLQKEIKNEITLQIN
jgi:hypothetical protein